jgi:hypothetical protein
MAMRTGWDSKEIISRATMIVVAAALAWAATAMIRFLIRVEDDDQNLYLTRIIVPIAAVMYILAFTFGCFVFASRDPRRAQVGRVMAWSDMIVGIFRRTLWRRWGDE